MKFFSTKKKLEITEADREWVESNFQWLFKAYGNKTLATSQKLFDQQNFPRFFVSESIENLKQDICEHLKLNADMVIIELVEDIRDSQNIYEVKGAAFLSDLSVQQTHDKDCTYTLSIAKSIIDRPKTLISKFIYELCKARLIESRVKLNSGSDKTLFIFIACTYFGYGVIMGQNLIDVGRSIDGLYEKKWRYASKISYQVMAYILAIYTILSKQKEPTWKTQLPSEMQEQFELSVDFIEKNSISIENKVSIDPDQNPKALFSLAYDQYHNGGVQKAIETLQKALLLTSDKVFLARIYNNIGFYKQKLSDFRGSLPDFENSLANNSEYANALNNIGFSYIMLDEFEKGKTFVEKAIACSSSESEYTHRNMGMYYTKTRDYLKAGEYFRKAFDENKPVDLLHLCYAKYLMEIGEQDEAIENLQISADLGEPESIGLLQSFQ